VKNKGAVFVVLIVIEGQVSGLIIGLRLPSFTLYFRFPVFVTKIKQN